MRFSKKHFLKKPFYPGGPKAMSQFIQDNLQYPEVALQNEINGKVHLALEVNDNGIVTNIEIVKGIGFGCDEEAVRVAKMLKFCNAVQRNVIVKLYTKIIIHFAPPAKQFEITYEYKEKPVTPNKGTIHYKITLDP